MSWLSEFIHRVRGDRPLDLPTSHPPSSAKPTGPIETAVLARGSVGAGDVSDISLAIQSALVAEGAVIAPDGEYGPLTVAAVRRFQASRSLPPTGFVDRDTARALDAVLARVTGPAPAPTGSILAAAPWLAQMRAITGVTEVPGSKNSPIIMSWRSDIAKAFPDMAGYAATYTGDEIPWCGFGLGGCVARCAPPIRPPDGFMYALNWSKWGVKLDAPVVGSVLTFRRQGGGHVGLCEGVDGDTLFVRGCNQSDTVNVIRRSRSDGTFVAATWPFGWPVKQNIPGDRSNAVARGSEA